MVNTYMTNTNMANLTANMANAADAIILKITVNNTQVKREGGRYQLLEV